MDLASFSQQQQRRQEDFLDSFFHSGEPNVGDNHRQGAMSGSKSRGNPSPASSSSSSTRDPGNGPGPIHTSSDTNSMNINDADPSSSPIFQPSSPAQPQSPNSQMTMQILGNLMQLQGLEGGFPMLPPASIPGLGFGMGGMNGVGGLGMNSPGMVGIGLGGMGYGGPGSMGAHSTMSTGMNTSGNVNSPSGTAGSSSVFGSTNTSSNASSNAFLEQQFKLSQLQQLQQLQNQIFQQQIALISGQSPPVMGSSSLSELQQQQQQNQNQNQTTYTGLQTPGASTELRPQQPQPLEYVSPMILNNYPMSNIEQDSLSQQQTHHPQSSQQHQRRSSQQHQHHHQQSQSQSQVQMHKPFRQPTPTPYSPQDDTFSQPSVSSHHGHIQFAQSHSHPHTHTYVHRGTNSAPEHIAFDIRSGPDLSPHMSGGASHDLDLDISPLTSPWLGAYGGTNQQSGGAVGNTGGPPYVGRPFDRERNSNKRTASSSGDESALRPSRKKQSPAIGPTLSGINVNSGGGHISQPNSQNNSSSNLTNNSNSAGTRRQSYRGSKSTNSTPLLRSTTRSRSRSGVGAGLAGGMMTPINSATTPTGNASASGMVMNQGTFGMPGDTPSPVDLSMPPPAPPASSLQQGESNTIANALDGGSGGTMDVVGGPSRNAEIPRLTPVTPASIMNLGRLGINTSVMGTHLGSGSSGTSLSAGAGANTITNGGSRSKAKGKAETAPKTGKNMNKVAQSPVLKPILPAAGSSSSTSTSPAQDPNPSSGPPLQVRKTSHKAAEQKRRDSLKTTFDELRSLLPPIALPDVVEEQQPAALTQIKGKDQVLPVRGPLLPGALPPRGPPKAGGEGPNKGVSKLQLLICGNEYIRTLKGRVERRNDEIGILRREVGRLRRKVGSFDPENIGGRRNAGGVGAGYDGMEVDGFEDGSEDREEEEEIDLEKDLDAVEGMGVHIGLIGGSMGDEDDDDE